MKKRTLSAISLLSLALSAAHAQSTVQVYGLLDTGVTVVDRVLLAGATQPGRVVSVHPGAMQASRMGFRGTENLGDGLKALFVLEGGLNPDVGTYAQGGIPFGRRAVVGLEGTFGTVFLGRQVDFLDDMGVMSAAMTFGAQVAPIHSLDRTYADRSNNSIRWNMPRVAGFRGGLMLGLGENTSFTAGQSRAAGLDYDEGPLRVSGAIFESRLGATAANTGQANIGAQAGAAGDVALRTYSVAATYQWGAARLMAMYSDVRQPLAVATGARSLRSASNKRTQIWDLGLNHGLTSALFLNLNYIADKAEFVGAADGRVKQYNVGLDWFLSKRTDLYANAGYQTASLMLTPGMGEGLPGLDRSQTLTRVGIRHKF